MERYRQSHGEYFGRFCGVNLQRQVKEVHPDIIYYKLDSLKSQFSSLTRVLNDMPIRKDTANRIRATSQLILLSNLIEDKVRIDPRAKNIKGITATFYDETEQLPLGYVYPENAAYKLYRFAGLAIRVTTDLKIITDDPQQEPRDPTDEEIQSIRETLPQLIDRSTRMQVVSNNIEDH